uniref:Agrin n=1 Tax=Strongyloides papillosus TaxID=174720 RepID=A0A0N5C960_STREA
MNSKYEPLCDNKNLTHDNYCNFKSFNCHLRYHNQQEREILYLGNCRNIEEINDDEIELSTVQISTIITDDFGGDSDYISSKESLSDELLSNCSKEDCGSDWDPICDTKNITHKNECYFKYYQCKISKQNDSILHDVSIAHKGICSEKKVSRKESFNDINDNYNINIECPKCDDEDGVFPVCDNRNVTFPTMCTLAKTNCRRRLQRKEETVLVHIGRCMEYSPVFEMKNERCPSNCSKEYKPVCDTNNMTHPNLCIYQMYNCEQRKRKNFNVSWLKSLKACTEKPLEPLTTTTVEPTTTTVTFEESENKGNMISCPNLACSNETSLICDSEGGTHQNECFFQKARCHAAQNNIVLRPIPDEMCGKEECLSKECDDDIDYVCGSDFKTYKNLCYLEKGKCTNKKLEPLFIGKCERCFQDQCPTLVDDDEDSLFVCDQNAETRSKCEFEMLRCIYEIKYGYNITEAYNGRCCPSKDNCPFDHQPVCDSKKKTHKNMCFYEVEKCRSEKIYSSDTLNILSEESCENYLKQLSLLAPNCTNIDKDCQNDYQPICGSDKITYINECDFNKKVCSQGKENSVRRDYDGECCQSEVECSLEWKPICDSDRVTHPNLCFFEARRCLAEKKELRVPEIDFYHPCTDNNCEMLECPQKYEPVCGNNGKTYINECFLNQTICYLNSTNNTYSSKLQFDYDGECCKTKESCPLSIDPVCDSNGNTHINECFFNREICRLNKKTGNKIVIEYKGECCKGECDKEIDNPICDGENTYKNICYFRKKQCDLRKLGKDILIEYYGTCCPNEDNKCPVEGEVCDREGNKYLNICAFHREECLQKKLFNKQLTLSEECFKVDERINQRPPNIQERYLTKISTTTTIKPKL